MLRWIFQLFKLISLKNLPKAIDHYANKEVVEHYKDLVSAGLYPDEQEVLIYLNKEENDSMLIVGAGAGREAIVFSKTFKQIVAFEPIKSMPIKLPVESNITFVDHLESVNMKFDSVFVSAFLPSFLNHDERLEFYKKVEMKLKKSGTLFLRPDIMPLTFLNSFRFLLGHFILKFRFFNLRIEKGDTIRSTLDKNLAGQSLVFYHYFSSENDFIKEVSKHFKFLEKLDSGYYVFGTLDD